MNIERLLIECFEPTHLKISDFSHGHSVPEGSESHVKVVIASESFASKNRVQRHRLVYSCLQDELNNGLHALQLHLYTEKELLTANIEPPPKCKGGSKRG
jgi:stress-induced morphogen